MNTRSASIRLATRGSALALTQARSVQGALERRRHDVELVEVETAGDQIRDELIHRLGKTGAFVRSLDERVLSGEVDGAVHSMKDMPTETPEELIVAAIPRRATPGDVLVTPDGATLDDLPAGATVGTGSLRRQAQVLADRPDLEVEPLRGNVDTRIEKLLAPHLQAEYDRRVAAEERASEENGGDESEDEDEPEYDRSADEWVADLSDLERQALEREVEVEYDAVVLAAAGLERADLADEVPTRSLATVPAAAQGALAVTMHDTDLAGAVHDAVDHPRTRVETTVERTILGALGGGCVAPIGIHAVVQGEHVHTRVGVFSRDGTDAVSATRDLLVERHAEAARAFAADLADRGARELIEDAKREADADETAADRSGE